MLDVLGLGPEEQSTYRQLVERPSSDVVEVADATGLDSLSVTRVLRSLEGKGLVARAGSDQEKYVASPPAVALGALLVQRQEDLRRAQAEVTELTGLYRGAERREVTDVIDVVHGLEAVAQRFAQIQLAARRQVQTLSKPVPAAVTREDNDQTEEANLARGVRYQAVVERSAFDTPGFHEAAEEALTRGAEVRVAASLPLRMVIVDREIALVTVLPEGADEPFQDGLLVHPSGLLDGLVALFDRVWDGAVRLGRVDAGLEEVAGEQLDEVEAKVLGMLLAGLTDQTIGIQLGMSLRTVQRRVRQMMDRAGVDTRLQLGFEAARRGWA